MEIESSKNYADRITKVLEYLKSKKISQYEIENRINYTSLSKAKNARRYPQKIIEKKSRQELLTILLDEYGLGYDEYSDKVNTIDKILKDPKEENALYYIMYYYAFARQIVGRAMVKIFNKKKVIMEYRLYEHWEGSCQIIENYTFLLVTKTGETTPVQKLICLFSGTEKLGRPILLGTYSTVKRDGIPAAGKILFERVYEKNNLERKLKADTDPRIAYYLMNKVLVTETFTPNSLDDLNSRYKLIQRFTGLYFLFFPGINRKYTKATLECFSDSSIILNLSNITYSGIVKPIDNHTLQFEMNDDIEMSNISENRIILFVNTIKSHYEPFYYCTGLSNAFESKCNSFESFLIEKELFNRSPDKNTAFILNKLKCVNTLT